MRTIIISKRGLPKSAVLTALGGAATVATVAALCLGEPLLTPSTALSTLTGNDAGAVGLTVLQGRLPRALLGLVAGAALAVAGLLLQDITRNRIAGPELLGVSSGAALVAATIVVFGLKVPLGWQPWIALLGAMVAGAVVLTSMARSRHPGHLALTGAAVSAALAGLVVAVVAIGTEGNVVVLLRYLLGSLAGRGWEHLESMAPLLVPAIVMAWLLRHHIDTLALGDEAAAGLGVHVTRTRVLGLACAAVLAGAVASICGPIAYVALLAPHLARGTLRTTGTSQVFVVSAVFGGVLLLMADLVSRLLFMPVEIPVGITTTVIGVPLLLLAQSRQVAR